MMITLLLTLNEIYASLEKSLVRNQKYDATDDADADVDDADGVVIPMCRPCFAGDTNMSLICGILSGSALFLRSDILLGHTYIIFKKV